MIEANYFEEQNIEHPFDFEITIKSVLGEDLPHGVLQFIDEHWSGDFNVDCALYSVIIYDDQNEIVGYNGFYLYGMEGIDPEVYTALRVINPKFRKKGVGTYLSALTTKLVYEHPETQAFPTKDSYPGSSNGARMKIRTAQILSSPDSLNKYWQESVLKVLEKVA